MVEQRKAWGQRAVSCFTQVEEFNIVSNLKWNFFFSFLFGILVWQKHKAPHGMNHHPECILCLFFMRRSCSPALLFFCPEQQQQQQQQLAPRVTVALRKRWAAEQEVCRDLRAGRRAP